MLLFIFLLLLCGKEKSNAMDFEKICEERKDNSTCLMGGICMYDNDNNKCTFDKDSCKKANNAEKCWGQFDGFMCAFENDECIPRDKSCSILMHPNECHKADYKDDHNWNCIWDDDLKVEMEQSCITVNDFCKKKGGRSPIVCKEIIYCLWDTGKGTCQENPKMIY